MGDTRRNRKPQFVNDFSPFHRTQLPFLGSLEEVLIALRDDRHLLDDPDGLVSGRFTLDGDAEEHGRERRGTLYPDGFDAARFVEVIETEAVWATM
jgi:hypothetical protein